jgi:hypothetical protein
MEVNGQLHDEAALPPGERTAGTQGIGGCEVEKNFLPLPEIEPRPSSQYHITTPTELSWLPLIEVLFRNLTGGADVK